MLMLHAHVTTWTIALILFVVNLFLLSSDNQKARKITHMILRVFYILLIITGGALVFAYHFWWTAVVKALLALLLIYLMEAILNKGAKGALKGGTRTLYTVLFIVDIILVFYFGYGVIG
jgi:hypothetical protein